MPLSSLENALPTIKSLHRAALLLAPINSALKPHLPNAQHLPLEIRPFGLRSTYPKGGSIILNFKSSKFIYYRPNGIPVEFALNDYTQKKLFEELLKKMQEDDLSDYLPDVKENYSEAFITKWVGGDTEKAAERLRHYQSEDLLTVDAKEAEDYGEVLYNVFTGIARFRARIAGSMSPLVVWAEHFDLSMLWFATSEMDESKPHVNIGFAPFTEGKFDEKPYLYAYAHPYPKGFTMPLLDEPLRWEHSAYHGIFVSYDEIARQEHPEQYVEQLCGRMFTILKRVLT